MNTFRLLRFLLPMQNPLGFALPDFLAVGVAGVMLAAILMRLRIKASLEWLAIRPPWAMGVLFALPIALRLLLLPFHPVPVPSVSDDFSYLLLGDTFAHLRLANATHPMHRFFETVFVLQEPSYSSIYPAGQGIVLAFGQVVFRCPWAGVVISIGLMCALSYWMLAGWVAPVWALVGGLIAVMEFGPLNQWMNNYWGGAVSAIAGCLVFGAVGRLRRGGTHRDGLWLGVGLGLQVITRPFEACLLALCVAPFLWRCRRMVLLALLPFLMLTLAQNKAVTGSWVTLPYMLSRAQYGIPATFTFQKMVTPSRELTQEQRADYTAQADVHDSAGSFTERLGSRFRFVRFFLFPPLFLAVIWFLVKDRRNRLACIWILAFFVGTNFYPYFYPHYLAAVVCLFLLASVAGLSLMRGDIARLLLLLCGAQFTFWYGMHLFGAPQLFTESWDYINFGDAERRVAFNDRLARAPGRQLVFVHYSPVHLLREWVHNNADIDGSRVVWALDLGPEEDAKLIAYYPDRKAWLVQPDSVPPTLSYYPTQ